MTPVRTVTSRAVTFYEIVVYGKGSQEPALSPTTYESLEAATKDLRPFHEAIENDGAVSLDWYSGKAANISRAVVRPTDEQRPPDPRTTEELIDDLKRLLPGVIVEEDQSPGTDRP